VITTKSNEFLPLPMCYFFNEFCENRLSSFCVIPLANKQIKHLSRWKHYLLGGGN